MMNARTNFSLNIFSRLYILSILSVIFTTFKIVHNITNYNQHGLT